MTKKTQPQSPEEVAQAFMQLWQEKWNETLRQKGWPTDAPMPGIGQMPFFNPFMPMNGFTSPAGDGDAIQKLEMRIAALEKKLAIKRPSTTKKSTKPKKSR